MNLWDRLSGRLTAPKMTKGRMALALLLALAADALQVTLAVPPAPEIIDVIAMLVMVWLLGFHVLLLPTFVVEFIPVVGMLPTWTACVAAVIALRKRAEGSDLQPPDKTDSSLPPASPPPQLPAATNPPPGAPAKSDLPPSADSNPS